MISANDANWFMEAEVCILLSRAKDWRDLVSELWNSKTDREQRTIFSTAQTLQAYNAPRIEWISIRLHMTPYKSTELMMRLVRMFFGRLESMGCDTKCGLDYLSELDFSLMPLFLCNNSRCAPRRYLDEIS